MNTITTCHRPRTTQGVPTGDRGGNTCASALQTPGETAESTPRDAYYRQALSQLGRANADRTAHRRSTGSYRQEPQARCVPSAEVRGEDVARSSGYTGDPTPKETAQRREAQRKHGQGVYDAANAFSLWKRLGAPRPTPPEHPPQY